MNKSEIEIALKNGTLVWNDPDPIEDADYTVNSVIFYGDEKVPEDEIDTVGIFYGGGSEAEVYKTELENTAEVGNFEIITIMGPKERNFLHVVVTQHNGTTFENNLKLDEVRLINTLARAHKSVNVEMSTIHEAGFKAMFG